MEKTVRSTVEGVREREVPNKDEEEEEDGRRDWCVLEGVLHTM